MIADLERARPDSSCVAESGGRPAGAEWRGPLSGVRILDRYLEDTYEPEARFGDYEVLGCRRRSDRNVGLSGRSRRPGEHQDHRGAHDLDAEQRQSHRGQVGTDGGQSNDLDHRRHAKHPRKLERPMASRYWTDR